MAHLAISMEANDASWGERCRETMEKLKNAGVSSSDSPSKLLQEKHSVENKFMSLELYQSVENNNPDMFVAQLEKIVGERRISLSDIGVQVTAAGDSLLHVAAHFGAEAVAELICIYFPELLTKTNIKGNTALHVAVQTSKCRRVIDLLLEASFVDNSLPSGRGISPLHAAISERDSDLLLHILEKKVEVMYLRDEDEGTPLHYAASIGYPDGVRELLLRSTQLALVRDKEGHLPIHLACKKGHIKVVKEFLRQKKWLNVNDMLTSQGENILHIASKNGQHHVVKDLLSDKNRVHELDINGKDKNGNTALHLASMRSLIQIVRLLARDDRVDFNINNNHELTASKILGVDIAMLAEPEFLPIVFKPKHSVSERPSMPDELPKEESVNDKLDTAIIVATLIMTVTFTAGFTLPGSVYSSDKPGSEFGGLAVLAHSAMFQMFLICNTIAMFASTTGCILLMGAQFFGPWTYYTLIGDSNLIEFQPLFVSTGLVFVGLALVSMSLAFMAVVRLAASNISWLANLVTIIAAVSIFYIVVYYIITIAPLVVIEGVKKKLLERKGAKNKSRGGRSSS